MRRVLVAGLAANVPTSTTYRAKQHGIGLLTTFNRRRRQRLSVVINGCAAYIVMAGGDTHRKSVAHGIQHFQRLGHHFRTNTVPGNTAIW